MSDEPFVIRGVDFAPAGFPRPFTMDERSIVRSVYDKVGVDKVQDEAVDAAVGPPTTAKKAREQLEKQFGRELQRPWSKWNQGRVESLVSRLVKLGAYESDCRDRVVARIDTMLGMEYTKDFDDWDDEAIDAMNEALAAQQKLLEQVRVKDLSNQMRIAEERQTVMEGVLEAMDKANLTVAYEIGRHSHLSVNGFKTWMRDATDDDYVAAEKLVQEGKQYAHLARRIKKRVSEPTTASSASEPTPQEDNPEGT